MRPYSRRRAAARTVEKLETRWYFSLGTLPLPSESAGHGSAHGCGCGCPICGRAESMFRVDAMVYVLPGSTLSDEELQTLGESDHGAGCGCPLCQAAQADHSQSPPAESGGVSADFVTSGEKWPQPGGRGSPVTITYSLSNLLTSSLGGVLSADTLHDAVNEALGLWAESAPLHFVELEDEGPNVSDNGYNGFGLPNIRIGHHSEDGRNGVLAHAYFPDGSGLAGDVHLDSDENWTSSPSFSGIDVIEVLTHEFGHSLGLAHEHNNDAIMNPFYSGRYDGPGTGFLFQDDINGIRAIYGTGVGTVTPLNRKPLTEPESFTLEEDEDFASTVSVLTNDVDPQDNDLEAVLVAGPAHGDLVLDDDGTFTYVPDANYFGADRFTYRATNGEYTSEATTVSLTVLPTFDAPVAAADAYSVRTGDVLRTGAPAEIAVAAGATWRFLDDGSNQETAWRAADFDDSGWQSGPAQLGYGEGDEATTVDFGPNPSDKHITTYFRTKFDLTDVDRIESLDVRLQRDDGAAVYLNGNLIARSNLSSTANFETPALIDVSGTSESRFFNFAVNVANLTAGTLREGRNVLAVELHQSRANSDDLSFDLSLTVNRDVAANPTLNDVDLDLTGLLSSILEPPAHGTADVLPNGSLVYTPTPGYVGPDVMTYRAATKELATLIASGANWRYLDTGANLGQLWYGSGFDDADWSIGRAQLGYGDGDESTSIEFGNPSNRHATTYFRKSFTLDDPTGVLALQGNLLRDDAAAVYLNGVEIYRDLNLPADADHLYYIGEPIDDENAFVGFDIPVALLTTGENVLAVEVHQTAPDDVDLSFDLNLVGQVVSAPAVITIDVTPTILGDVDFNGRVDLDDLNLVRGNFGGDASVLLGDANRDGAIDLADLNAVRNNFGAVAPSPTVVASPAANGIADVTVVVGGARGESNVTRVSSSSRTWDTALLDLLSTSENGLSRFGSLARKRITFRSV